MVYNIPFYIIASRRTCRLIISSVVVLAVQRKRYKCCESFDIVLLCRKFSRRHENIYPGIWVVITIGVNLGSWGSHPLSFGWGGCGFPWNIIISYYVQEFGMRTLPKVVTLQK